jgi:hypothetical protein
VSLLCIALLAALLSGQAVAFGMSEPVVPPEGAGQLIPSQSCRGLFIVPLTLGGATLQMLLDTGSSWTFLDPIALNRALGRRVDEGRAEFALAAIGDHSLGRLKARVYPMGAIARAVGFPIDGILGFPAFENVLLTLDYPASEVRVDEGSLPPPNGREIFRDTGWKRPFLEARLGGRKLEFLLDSGATPGHVQLRPGDRVEWLAEPRPAKATARFGGVAILAGGRLKGNLGFGPLEVEAPVAFLAKGVRLVGWQILRHLALTFDQENKRVRIVPEGPSTAVTTPSFVSKGVGMRPRLEGLEVIKVFADTSVAAAETRLEEGDLVVSIDGVPVYQRPCLEPEGDPENTRLQVSYLRDGTEARVEIRTIALIP